MGTIFRRFCFALGAFVAAFPHPAPAHAASSYDSQRLFGTDYVDARDFARRFGLEASWTTANKSMRLKSRWTTIDLTVHRTETELNGLLLFLSEPIVLHQGSLHLSRGDADRLLAPILAPHLGPTPPPLKNIVIDPGHGGNDPGNQNTRFKFTEKIYTLDVARRLERLLKARGFRVMLTRKNDRRVELDDRTAIARRVQADLFISIHFNGFADSRVNGAETYILTPFRQRSTPQPERDRGMLRETYAANRHDHWNAVLGYHVHRQLIAKSKAADRGLKRFRYHVLRHIHCPAVLIEAGFLSNEKEGRKIATRAYRQQIAEAIAAGVKAHADALERARARKG